MGFSKLVLWKTFCKEIQKCLLKYKKETVAYFNCCAARIFETRCGLPLKKTAHITVCLLKFRINFQVAISLIIKKEE